VTLVQNPAQRNGGLTIAGKGLRWVDRLDSSVHLSQRRQQGDDRTAVPESPFSLRRVWAMVSQSCHGLLGTGSGCGAGVCDLLARKKKKKKKKKKLTAEIGCRIFGAAAAGACSVRLIGAASRRRSAINPSPQPGTCAESRLAQRLPIAGLAELVDCGDCTRWLWWNRLADERREALLIGNCPGSLLMDWRPACCAARHKPSAYRYRYGGPALLYVGSTGKPQRALCSAPQYGGRRAAWLNT